jgi:hypothetical protein
MMFFEPGIDLSSLVTAINNEDQKSFISTLQDYKDKLNGAQLAKLDPEINLLKLVKIWEAIDDESKKLVGQVFDQRTTLMLIGSGLTPPDLGRIKIG